jgi:hypothetical protein
MLFVYSIFFGMGVGAFAYTKMGRRLGYGNSANVWTVTGIATFIGFVIFYTLLTVVFGLN